MHNNWYNQLPLFRYLDYFLFFTILNYDVIIIFVETLFPSLEYPEVKLLGEISMY